MPQTLPPAKLDEQTYRRAANAALIGLATQVVVYAVILLLGLYAESSAMGYAGWYVLGGIPLWIVLWALFNQHGLERREALEAEQLATDDAQAAALFNEAGQQLALHRRRLDGIYKYGLNVVSAVVAVYLIAVGGLFLWVASALPATDENGQTSYAALLESAMKPDANQLLMASVLVGVAFVGFLVSRYVAGMTRLAAWQPLRGGASYLMGNVVVTIALLAAVIIQLAYPEGETWPLAVLAYAVPIAMMLLGVEMTLSFVFGLYRPRRIDEPVRPAFDSRVLGWLVRPESLGRIVSETLNYQFGFEISRSWFFSLGQRLVTPLAVIGVLILVGFTCVVIVAPQQQAVITFNGQIDRVVGPGVTLKAPWPLGGVQKIDAFRVKQIRVGSVVSDDKLDAILWTNIHNEDQEEVYLVTAPVPSSGEIGDGGDEERVAGELAGAELAVNYKVRTGDDGVGLRQYVTAAANPRLMLEDLALRRLNEYTVTHDIEQLLHDARLPAGDIIRAQLQADADALALGVDILWVGLTNVHPPQAEEVAATFHKQIDAELEKQTTIAEARRDAVVTLTAVAGSRDKALAIRDAIDALNRVDAQEEPEVFAAQQATVEALLDEAGGEAAQVIYEARAYRWRQGLAEQARANNFAAQAKAFDAAPDYFRARLYLQTIAEQLESPRKTVLGSQAAERQPTIRIDLKDASSRLGTIFGEPDN